MELHFRDIARSLCLSLGTMHNHFKRFEATGDVKPLSPSTQNHIRALNGQQELIVIGLLLENPALYLSDVCQLITQATGIHVSPPTLCQIIHRHGLTRKKIKQVAIQRSVGQRGEFMAEIQFFDVNQLVWLDETGSDNRDRIRKFGYSLKGEPPIYNRILHCGECISVICAMSADGLLAYTFTKGTVNDKKFLEFIQGTLIAEMLPFDGEKPRPVLMLDNCSIHHVRPVTETLRHPYTIPSTYSPDMNPAEELFSYYKQCEIPCQCLELVLTVLQLSNVMPGSDMRDINNHNNVHVHNVIVVGLQFLDIRQNFSFKLIILCVITFKSSNLCHLSS